MALGMLAVLTVFAGFQHYLAMQSHRVVHRAHLSTLVLVQGHSAIEELVDQIGRDANRRGSALYDALRGSLARTWTEIDLEPCLREPSEDITPRWGRKRDRGLASGSGLEAEVHDYDVVMRAPRYASVAGGTEEYVCIVTLSADVEARNPHGGLRRWVSATYELRAVVTAPPRPMDQVGLFVQNASAVSNLAGLDQERTTLLDGHESFRQRLGAAGPTLSDPDKARFAELAASMKPRDFLAAHAPEFAAAPDAVLFGPLHGGIATADSLDLVGRLRRYRQDRQQVLADFEAAMNGPGEKGEKAQAVVSRFGLALNEMVLFRSQFAVVRRDDPRLVSQVAPYFDRFTPEFFLNRVHLRLSPEDELWTRWAAGEARLDGVVLLVEGAGEVSIAGRTRGQVVLVAPGRKLRLGALPTPDTNEEDALMAQSHRLVVASLGGEVSVEGDARAAVFMLPGPGGRPGGRAHVLANATLLGSLAVPDARPGQVVLDGGVRYDGALRAPTPSDPPPPPDVQVADPYTFVLSPSPLF